MLFGLLAPIGCRNHVLDGVQTPEVLRDVAMAINFGTQFAVTDFVGYTFGSMIVAARCLIPGLGFRGPVIRRSHSRYRVPKGRCHGNQFWDYNCYNWLCLDDSD